MYLSRRALLGAAGTLPLARLSRAATPAHRLTILHINDFHSRHEAVNEAAAIGVDDDDYGKRLRAFVVLEDGKNVDEDDLKAFVKSNLARYKVPREIVFLDELPRNATGKLLKRELEKDGEDESAGDESSDKAPSEESSNEEASSEEASSDA